MPDFSFPSMIYLIRFFLLIALGLISGCQSKGQMERFAVIDRLEHDLLAITKTEESRNYENLETLNEVAQYIFSEFSLSCDTVFYQSYQVWPDEFKNVVARIGPEEAPKIIVGAHYDVCGEQEGADDNASGVVGLLELARLLQGDSLRYQIEFDAYTLEEPPFFGTEEMGSFMHAKSLFDNGEVVKGMICLEMIGYYNDEPGSQRYPVGLLKLFYGSTGDFITVVQKYGNGPFGRQVNRLMKKQGLIETKSFKGLESIPGMDLSDHRNYWHFGYSAVMITNTAHYRNPHYHQMTDRIETLDLQRMSRVIDEVYLTLRQMD